MLAQVIITAARKMLGDRAGVRWSDADLLAWLNSGQRQIVAVRPDAKSKKATMALVAGIEQTLPADGIRLLSVLHNMRTVGATVSPGRVITLTTREELYMVDVGWTFATADTTHQHYVYDDDAPKSFEVYPPAVAGNKIRINYAVLPTDCAAVGSAIDLDDIYEGPLTDWVCYRSFMQDSDDQQDGGRAANHLAAFMQALTGKSTSDAAYVPKRK